MAKKSYHPPAIIEASQFERRTLLTGCAKANPACLDQAAVYSAVQSARRGTPECQIELLELMIAFMGNAFPEWRKSCAHLWKLLRPCV